MEKKKQFAIIDDVDIDIDRALGAIDDWMTEYKEGSRKWKRLYKTRELIADVMCDLEHLAWYIDKE